MVKMNGMITLGVKSGFNISLRGINTISIYLNLKYRIELLLVFLPASISSADIDNIRTSIVATILQLQLQLDQLH
jgi:hypothetical protein